MADYTLGDNVRVNGVVATVLAYDEGANIIIYKVEQNNSVNTVTAHISNSLIEPLTSGTPGDDDDLIAAVIESEAKRKADQPELPFEDVVE